MSIGNAATHVINGAVFKLKYDVISDLEPVVLLPRTSFLLDARTSIPAKSLQEFVAWGKASPKPLVSGTPGVGSIPHMAGILFGELSGVQLSFVPYRGAAPAMQDLIAGQIDMMFDQAWNSLAQVGPARCAPTPSLRPRGSPRRRTFRPSTRPAFPASMSRYGTASGCRRARRPRSSRSSPALPPLLTSP
jgi:tripartite-type tricarboxylate transporter receptor subunit TctC